MNNIFRLIVSLLILVACAVSSTGQELPAPSEIEAFFDGVIESRMKESNIVGSTVIVVENGAVVFNKGYGFQDMEAQIPVDGENTIFRIGSVSKLLVWTAVMQLWEKGKLDLDADVNAYLDFEIPDTFEEAITLRHLLGHSAGFEDRNYETMARTPEDLIPLGEWLESHIPARVIPPGESAMYSNYGATLAGYIVEQVSGMSFETYLESQIFIPLGMKSSTIRQPLPARLLPDLALGYKYERGEYQEKEFDTFHIAPAGSVSSSAGDMAIFMMAMMNEGAWNGENILEPQTARTIQSQIFANSPESLGLAHGWMEYTREPSRIIGHGGDTLRFHSQLSIIPGLDTGIFISCNSVEGMQFPQIATNAFVNKYVLGTPAAELQKPLEGEGHAYEVTGRYRNNRMSYTTAERLITLVMNMPIHAVDEHTLLMKNTRFIETAPWIFSDEKGGESIHFEENRVYFTGSPVIIMERIPFRDRLGPNLVLMLFILIVILLVLAGRPITGRIRKKSGAPPLVLQERRTGWILTATMALLLIYLLILISGLMVLIVDDSMVNVGELPGLTFWKIGYIVVWILTLLLTTQNAYLWSRRESRISYRILNIAAGLSCWGVIILVSQWNLLHW